MKIRMLTAAAALCVLLSGCASLLERSYSVVEPYADRYWDASAEDTLRAENYQDLVNSLLLLVEQRVEEGVIRYYYSEGDGYSQALDATNEVRKDTMLGSYLLEQIAFNYKAYEGYCTLTYQMSYRQDAEDVDTLMVLSDSQSLVDLLRLAVREGHDKLTARFAFDMSRLDVEEAIASLWQEICTGEEETVPPVPEEEEQTAPPEEGQTGETGGEEAPAEPGTEEPLPPCPWEIRFYPDQEAADLVEILLRP